MLGRRSELQGKVAEMNSKTRHLNCVLHRYALACKTLAPGLILVLGNVVHMINIIKSSFLNTSLFFLLCLELGNDREALLFHTEVRWLSELSEFFKRVNKTRSSEFVQKLSDSQWLQKLAYLFDIFSRLNLLNLFLQGRFHIIIDFMDKLRKFNMKLILWEKMVKVGNLGMFENLDEALNKTKTKITGNLEVVQLVQAHLSGLLFTKGVAVLLP